MQQGNVPATPARPTVSSVAHDSVSITWSDTGDSSITGCQVLRRIPEVHERQELVIIEDDTGGAATGYPDTGVAAETRYFYRLMARNAHGGRG